MIEVVKLFFIAWLFLGVTLTKTEAKEYILEAVVVKIIDGDTVQVVLDNVHVAFSKQSIRLHKIDTAETGNKAKCLLESQTGEKSKLFLKSILPVGSKVVIVLDTSNQDKYNGRILSDIYYKRKSVVKAMKDSGLAKDYAGGKKPDWCK